MEVDDEEEGGIFDGVDDLGGGCGDGDEEELMKARVLVKVKASLEK